MKFNNKTKCKYVIINQDELRHMICIQFTQYAFIEEGHPIKEEIALKK